MNDSPASASAPLPSVPEKMSFLEKLSFGAGDLGPAITANVLVFFLAFFFTDVAGLPAALAAWILAIGKVWDAVNDPIVGFLSDRTQSRWGRRHPWMIFGAIPFGLFFFLQWIVPDFSNWGKFWFYVGISILFNMAYTIVNLPYTALTPELTQDYNERTSLNSFRFAFSIGGSLLSLVLALFIFEAVEDLALRYIILAGVCTVLSVLPLYLCVWGTRKRVAAMDARRAQTTQPTEAIPFFEQVKIAFSNVPFLYVMGIYLCSWLAVQVTATIIQYYVVSWMALPGAAFTQIAFAVQATALLMLFVWTPISRRVGKRAVYFMGMGIWIIAQAGLFFLQPGQVPLLYVLAVMAGIGVSTAYLIPWSMLPDVIDLDELKTGQRREGVFYAFMVLLQKVGLAIGLFLVLKALGWAGYIESTAGQPAPVQPESALFAIRIAIGPLPTIVLIAGIVLAYFYPITQEVHTQILLKLQEKRNRDRERTEE
ncbi:MFS transporter [Oscillatoriales cyanobacterium LEGE 11467]|uniref:MFS transporter n=1 Tax=Zarconia navalis LEGE 11467 TaxID=1828826 RepID=A0A928VUU7_9CYAN|nr:MFS transporter [Zarconia navalis]MBE9039723.1 MFS transporter [Zarconia navalis LEGE 11467]